MRKIYVILETECADNAHDLAVEAWTSKKEAKKRIRKLSKENMNFIYGIHIMGLNVTSKQFIKKLFKKG